MRYLIPFTLFYLCELWVLASGAQKIRYHKAAARHRSENDIYNFLTLIDPDYAIDHEPPPFTTPPPALNRPLPTVRSKPRHKDKREYCLKRRGQFAYGPDCHKYVDCWDGQVFLKFCNPRSLVFNPQTRQCTWPHDPQVSGRCNAVEGESDQSYQSDYNDVSRDDVSQNSNVNNGGSRQTKKQSRTDFSQPFCSDFAHLGYECVDDFKCQNGEIRNVSDINIFEFVVDVRSGIRHVQPTGKFSPWMKICNSHNDICCKNPNFAYQEKVEKKKRNRKSKALSHESETSLCPNGFSGLMPFPSDCSKFANCWKGRPTVQNCAPGTKFNKDLGQCDFPSKANCKPKRHNRPNVSPSEEIERSSVDPSGIVFPSPPSGQRVRLRGGRSPYSGYLELHHSGKWGLVCDSTSWTIKEANVVCKQLGFKRGVRATTQGLIYGPVNEERKQTESISCEGDENGLEKCQIQYSSSSSLSNRCKLSEEIVSVTCIHDSFAACPSGEVPFGDSCYSVHFNRSSFDDAQRTCKLQGKTLVEIDSQEENDLLSELLLQNQYSPGILSQMWTGGQGSQTARSQLYYWNGSGTRMSFFRPWWPGWNGERKGSLDLRNTMGVKISRKYDFVSRRKREERLIDYYFWALEDLETKLAYICERKQKDIGCIKGKGEDYRGSANRGESGDICVEWDSPELSFVLDKDKIPNLGPLEGNNFCRNPDGDSAPWCIAPNGEFDYCDIPECQDGDIPTIGITVANEPEIKLEETMLTNAEKCGSEQFQCRVGECILSAYVCDGHGDCLNGRDEEDCNQRELDKYNKNGGRRLNVAYIERWLDTTAKACAIHCKNARGFLCKSFNYHAAKRLCTLSEDNIGSSGAIVTDRAWDYYELASESKACDPSRLCPSGKCLDESQLCDGKDDCGDKSDEQSCSNKPNLKLRLVGGKASHEGRVEIKAFNYPYGGICDDGFNIEEANVICRQLGFPLGAQEAVINSQFGSGSGPILLDELSCEGSESNLLDCHFSPWTQHDCSKSEWAGVVCKNKQKECHGDEEWQCGSGECIPMDFLCDGRSDCQDNSDETKEGLCGEPIDIRLAEGNNATSGRVEVRYKGVWGTICDDNFGEEEGAVVCRMLGFEGKAVIHSEAAFNPGKGPIWIQNIQCNGNERSLQECRAPSWQPTYQCKHLEDVGVECIPFQSSGGSNSINTISGNVGGRALQCGQSSVPETPAVPIARLAGGLQSKPGSNPWAASIRLQGTQRSFHWCGAVILSEFHILTVAHCMEDYPKDVYRVRVGDWDMQVPDVQEQEFSVQAVHFHDEYNVGLYLNNDIALVRIKSGSNGRGITFGDRVVPACLPPVNAVYGPHLNCTVAGWGSTGLSKPGYTRYLQSASLPLLDTEQCIAPHVYGPNKLGSGMFCAGFLEGGVDTCQGDSGGGFVCDIRDRKAIMGLTSWGYGCGRPNRPGVYTKVADYLEWIVDKMTL